MFESDEILQEIHFHLKKLLELVNKHGSKLLQIETLLLESRIALLQLDGKQMKASLQKAKTLANQTGSITYIKRIDRFIKGYIRELEKVGALGQSNDMTSRIKEVGINNYLQQVSKLVTHLPSEEEN